MLEARADRCFHHQVGIRVELVGGGVAGGVGMLGENMENTGSRKMAISTLVGKAW